MTSDTILDLAGTVVVEPAPGDVELDIAERAARRWAGGSARSMTLPGGFSLAALDHEPFPLVRRRG